MIRLLLWLSSETSLGCRDTVSRPVLDQSVVFAVVLVSVRADGSCFVLIWLEYV